jgi:hypothetical protein
MHSELSERCRLTRELISVPPFPLASIRSGAQHPTRPPARRRPFIAIALASLSIVTIAAAAEITHRAHIQFTPTGGIIIQADPKTKVFGGPIHSDKEIREAATRLNFAPILPEGLPDGTKPIRVAVFGPDLLAITYDLPGAQRRTHHMLWISIANPTTMAKASAPDVHKTVREMRMSQTHWRVGPEEVIVVSNGATDAEIATIKRAMQRTAR